MSGPSVGLASSAHATVATISSGERQRTSAAVVSISARSSRTGAWFRYGDAQLGQGREKVRDYLKDNPKLVEELKEKIMAAGAAVAPAAVAAEPEVAAEE